MEQVLVCALSVLKVKIKVKAADLSTCCCINSLVCYLNMYNDPLISNHYACSICRPTKQT